MIDRIGHINIKTPAFEATLAFYERLFDLVRWPALTMADQQRNAWLSTADGEALIHVNTAPDDAPAAGVPSRLDHVAFACGDVAAMRARLDRLGIAHVHGLSRVPGLEQIFFQDPNGIRIELTFDRRDRR